MVEAGVAVNPERRTLQTAGLRSVDRALRLLELLADADGDLTVSEIARRLGVHKATASRLVATLGAHGLVSRNGRTDGVGLGLGLARLAGATMARIEVVRLARDILRDLAATTQETASLGVLDEGLILYVDEVASSSTLVTASWIGRRAPVHATSDGKILLAHLPDTERERLLRRPLRAATPHTIVDVATLRAEIEEARTLGFARAVGEVEVGLNGVAAAVLRPDGVPIATLSVAGPAYRVTPERLPELGAAVRRSAQAIARRVGHGVTSEIRR